jgi:hypothetical protein
LERRKNYVAAYGFPENPPSATIHPFGTSSGNASQLVLPRGDDFMSLGTILLIVIVIALLGGFSGFGGGPFYGTGYYGGGGLGLILVIVLILVLLGKL